MAGSWLIASVCIERTTQILSAIFWVHGRRSEIQAPAGPHCRIGAIGYCLGGAIVLGMARAGKDLDAVVSFHGSLATDSPAKKGAVKARVLACHGDAHCRGGRIDLLTGIDERTGLLKDPGIPLSASANHYRGCTSLF